MWSLPWEKGRVETDRNQLCTPPSMVMTRAQGSEPRGVSKSRCCPSPHTPALASPRNELCLQRPLPAAIGREGPSASEPHISVPPGCGDHEYLVHLILNQKNCSFTFTLRPQGRSSVGWCPRGDIIQGEPWVSPRGLGCCCFSVFASCGSVLSQCPLSPRGLGIPSPLGYH